MTKKILIVEDEYYLAEIIKQRLEFKGYEVDTAEDGSVALKKVEQFMPHLILMDQVMPIMDGVATTTALKQNAAYKNIPVIFLSALSRESDVEKARAAGAEDYLKKPFEFDTLLNKVQYWLSL